MEKWKSEKWKSKFRVSSLTLAAVLCALTVVVPMAQGPAGPTFEVVSIKPNTSGSGSSSMRQLPDGGFILVNGSVTTLLGRAYPIPTADMIGLPAWTSSERYDVTATAALGRNPSPDGRRQMQQAMLTDRFKLAAHVETREQQAFALVVARSDGKLGPQLKPAAVDCAARAAAQRAAAEAARAGGAPPPPAVPFVPPAPGSPAPPCSFRMGGNRLEGDLTMASLASMLRSMAGRVVVDKTGLAGSYSVVLESAVALFGAPGPDAAAPTPGDAPSIFTALQEQLGLKLESTRTTVEVLVIDRIERPSEN